MKTSTTSPIKKILKLTLISAIWLVVWQVISMLINEEILFVSPLSVINQLSKMCVTAPFWHSVLASMARVLGGFVVGFILAIALAVCAHWSSFFKDFVSPIISIVKATPVASFILLALMWIGKELVPVFICMLMVLPIVWSNTLSGLSKVDTGLKEMAQIYHMSPFKRLKLIYMPSLYPYLMAASGSGLGLCWKAGIAAEVICRTIPSIGNNIWETKFYISTDQMFAWTAVVIVLSVIFDKLIAIISHAVLNHYRLEETDDNIE